MLPQTRTVAYDETCEAGITFGPGFGGDLPVLSGVDFQYVPHFSVLSALRPIIERGDL